MSELLTMKGIGKSFGTVRALEGVDLTLKAGEVLALMGENGAGKSTLMNVLSGSLSHFDGEVRIGGKPVTLGSPIAARGLGIAMIHQELQLAGEMTVAENIFMGREWKTALGFIDTKGMEREAERYLAMLELDIRPSRRIKTLRVGERQMVEIAKALSQSARILIMDEPTSAISKQESEKLFAVIRRLAKENVGIIYITHRMEEVFAIADRLMVLRDSKLIGCIPAAEATREQIISMMVGREISEMYPKENVQIGEEALRVENLSMRSGTGGRGRALRNISFSVHKGEVLGIAGLLGSGRSELFEALFGVHARNITGSVYIEGERVTIRNPRDAIRLGLSFATEDRKGTGLVLPRSIGENMSLPMLRAFTKGIFMDKKSEIVAWQKQMDDMRVKAPSYRTLVETLSGGNQQKVVLGRWLIGRPKVLLLDEPTRGIDVGAKTEIYGLITKLAQAGLGILVISSELPELIGISDRIITLCEGRKTAEFNRAEFSQENILSAATLREEEAL